MPTHTGMLTGQYALVTGASRGIGRAIAATLAEAGCSVGITARTEADVVAAAKEIADRFMVRTLAVPCDLTARQSVAALFQQIRTWSDGRLDLLVCNAGYPFQRELWETPLHAINPEFIEPWFLSVFRTDLLGSVFCTYEALPLMMARKSGSIVYVSSTPAIEGYHGAPYTVAKAGILGLMRDIAREYGRFNIRANALALGNIRTPATYERIEPAVQTELAEEAPLRRWGRPEEVAGAVLFLAADLSAFITGQTLVVDGGTVRR
jgi:NAD(P)-dependent dehydrogenase (short-subunit alcohol dehydrogenase family)